MLESLKATVKRVAVHRLRRIDASRRIGLGPFGGLPPDLWGYEILDDGELALLGHRTTALAEQFGTPLHVVHLPWLRKTHDEFLRPLKAAYPNVRLATSYKTNPLPSVLRELHKLGTCAEVISEFELWLAGHLGLDGERIIVNGPGKSAALVERAVDMNVKLINIDGLGEIELIARQASRANRRQPVGVRVVTSVGWSSQFGLAIANGDAFSAFERIRASPALVATGIHLHIGTGLKDVPSYVTAIREVLEFAERLKRELLIDVRVFDFGGGFGVATVRAADSWDDRMVALGYPAREAIPADCPRAIDYAIALHREFGQLQNDRSSAPEVIFEPGRAITSAAQTLLLRIIAVKNVGGIQQLILDGGKNITLPLGWETHKVFPTRALAEPFEVHCDLYGPLCHPGDIVSRHLSLPRLRIGDGVAIMDSGAYFIPNQMNFSNPRPAVVLVDRDGLSIARRRESFDDIVRLDDFG